MSLLRDARLLTPTTRVVSVMLQEPPKAPRPRRRGRARPREAAAVLFDNAAERCYEVAVDLTAGR